MYEIGKTEDNPAAKGLAFLIHPKFVSLILRCIQTVVKMEINLQGKDPFTVIYAFGAEDEKMAQFYDDIERAMADSDTKYKIITGDFNARIGTKAKEEYFKSMGVFGIGERNKKKKKKKEIA